MLDFQFRGREQLQRPIIVGLVHQLDLNIALLREFC